MTNDSELQEKMNRLSMMQHTMTNYQNQKQGLQQSLIEIDSALGEVKDSPEVYRIIGNVIVKQQSTKVIKELTEKKETVSLRIDAIEKQEKQLEQKAKSLQDEVVALMQQKE